MDIQFVKFQTNELSEAERPSVLQAYIDKFHEWQVFFSCCQQPSTDPSVSVTSSSNLSLPDPPISWRVPGKTYVLHDFSMIRQTVEPVTPETTVVVESAVDMDSKQRSAYCEVRGNFSFVMCIC
jgi:hypothetical protein